MKVEQQLSKIEWEEAQRQSDDDDITKDFDVVTERKKRQVKLGMEEYKKEKVKEGWEKKMRKKKKEAVSSREERKKIRQKHVKKAGAKAGEATCKTKKKEFHRIIWK